MTRGISKSFLYLLPFLLVQIYGCDPDNVFTSSITMKSEKWDLNTIAEFNPEITDTSSVNNISFVIRTGSAYPFRNLWLFVSTTSPSGRILTDTLQYYLADEKGKWYGKGFGDIRELVLPFKSSVYFPEKGTYEFMIRHGMRADELKGVYDFSLRIDRVKE